MKTPRETRIEPLSGVKAPWGPDPVRLLQLGCELGFFLKSP